MVEYKYLKRLDSTVKKKLSEIDCINDVYVSYSKQENVFDTYVIINEAKLVAELLDEFNLQKEMDRAMCSNKYQFYDFPLDEFHLDFHKIYV